MCILVIPQQLKIDNSWLNRMMLKLNFKKLESLPRKKCIVCVLLVYTHDWILDGATEFMHCDEILLLRSMGDAEPKKDRIVNIFMALLVKFN